MFLLAGTAAVALAAAYYSKRNAAPKRHTKQSSKLQHLLDEVRYSKLHILFATSLLKLLTAILQSCKACIGKCMRHSNANCCLQYRRLLDVSAETLSTIRDEMLSQVGGLLKHPHRIVYVSQIILQGLLLQMNKTLSGKGTSSLMMLPSMVDKLPNGYAHLPFIVAHECCF